MRHGKYEILVLSILLSAILFLSYVINEWDSKIPIIAYVVQENHTEELVCWKDYWNNYCFFLPSYADLSMVQICSQTNDEIWIGEHMLTRKGMACDQFRLNENYGLARIGKINHYDGVIRFIQSDNVPTMYIDVQSGNMEYIHQKKKNEESGTMRVYTVDGLLGAYGNIESIKGRGNATWKIEKKSYSMTLSDPVDLLGMGQAQRWILLSNGYDPSNLRNKIGYDLANSVGMEFSPDSKWVDLFLNGEYAGLYLLCERNEVHPERVNISADNSFLISREGAARLLAQNYPYFNMKLEKAYRIHYSSIAPDEMEAIWMSVENALLSKDGIDPRTGKHWLQLIDLDSWVKRYLIDEITASCDGGRISQFYYYDGESSDKKVHAGPVWDLDITFGWDWSTASPNCFSPKRPLYPYGTEESAFDVLYRQEEFQNRMVELYQKEFRPQLMKLINSDIDSYVEKISSAVNADHERWLTDSPEEHNKRIKEYLTERVSFLDAIWLEKKAYYDVRLVYEGYYEAWFAVWPGERIPDIPEFDNATWHECGSNVLFDITQPIYESVDIYLKQVIVQQETAKDGIKTLPFFILTTALVIVATIDKMRNRKIRKDKHD